MRGRGNGRSRRGAVVATLAVAISGTHCGAGNAATVRVHSAEGESAFLSGAFEGTRLDDDGALTLAARQERVASIAEPFAFSLAALGDGWAVGTGNAGRVLRVARDGAVTELFAAPEPEIFALWADPDGTLFAGSSPDGKVYRIRGGKAEPTADVVLDHVDLALGVDVKHALLALEQLDDRLCLLVVVAQPGRERFGVVVLAHDQRAATRRAPLALVRQPADDVVVEPATGTHAPREHAGGNLLVG